MQAGGASGRDQAVRLAHAVDLCPAEIRSFEAGDRERAPARGVVFIGSSSIRLWTTLAQDFPRHHVLNRGFGGSHVADSVAVVERIVVPYARRWS